MTAEPNGSLARLYRESGWTLRQFAQEVNRLGTERGTPLRYREPSVHQWLKGHLPKSDVRPLVAEALSRRLRRPITQSEAGFPAPQEQQSGSPGTAEDLMSIGANDVLPGRRSILGVSLFSAAFSIPAWQDIAGRMESVRSGSAARIGASDVEVVTKMTERLHQMYGDFGGRTSRPLAAAFLVNEVVSYLRADATDSVRKEMMSAASFLCYMTGWMAVDEGLHGLAQQYYTKALELAGASSDHLTYCHVLRGMSVQAADLGHGPDAVRLAEAASSASPQSGPRIRAFMGGQLAHSYALAGERSAALRSLRETEKFLDAAESRPGTFGGFSPSTLAYATAQVRYHVGDVGGSIESLKLHFRLRDSTDTKVSELRFGSILAERQLEAGHLEAACRTWGTILDNRSGVRSGRVDRQLAGIAPRVRPYRRNAAAREIYERTRSLSAPG
ncbi:tetratricopeptide repeat protein [Streptomyces tsukubensis]|uniref:tetratricopeptide repeat protein n=1 Tax=Streptomyces tsukubensis TaxID=83656 RepID=UPI00344D5B49